MDRPSQRRSSKRKASPTRKAAAPAASQRSSGASGSYYDRAKNAVKGAYDRTSANVRDTLKTGRDFVDMFDGRSISRGLSKATTGK
jgi:hypothetical protein